jgi:hypothetical protein
VLYDLLQRLSLLICPLSSPISKNISVFTCPKSHLQPSPSHPTEGRIAIVTDAGRDAVDAAAFDARWDRRAGFLWRSVSDQQHADERRLLRTAKSCGPDAPTLASSSRKASRPYRARTSHISAGDGGKRARSPGRARHKLLKPLRAGMPGDPVDLWWRHSCATNTLHTRLRVQRAPGIPHALCCWARDHQRLGCIAPRGRERVSGLVVIARSNATKQSILSWRRDGLLRGACHRARIRATRWLAMTALQ